MLLVLHSSQACFHPNSGPPRRLLPLSLTCTPSSLPSPLLPPSLPLLSLTVLPTTTTTTPHQWRLVRPSSTSTCAVGGRHQTHSRSTCRQQWQHTNNTSTSSSSNARNSNASSSSSSHQVLLVLVLPGLLLSAVVLVLGL